MYCANCGTQIPDEANFCWKCGKPQKSDSEAKETIWEVCEIVQEQKPRSIVQKLLSTYNFDGRYEAKAIGPKGVYVVGATQIIHDVIGNPSVGTPAVNALIEQLVKDGWEPTGRGEQWYNHRFRRRAK